MTDANIDAFRPDAYLALDRFVSRARSLPIFHSEHPHPIDFDEPSWNLVGHITLPHARANTRIRIPAEGSLHDAFKAIIAMVLWESRKNKKSIASISKFTYAGRRVAEVLDEEELAHAPHLLRVDHLDAARARRRTNRDLPGALNVIAAYLSSEGIALDLEGYHASFYSRDQGQSRLSPKKAREPISDEIAYAIAEAFHRAENPRDQIVTSILALLTCTPSRISEVLILPADTDVMEAPGEGFCGPDTSFSEDIRFHYGLRWFPVKGGRPAVKFVPREMVLVATEALRRLRLHTKSARLLASWMMENPAQMPLPDALAHARVSRTLTFNELKQHFGSVAVKRTVKGIYERIGYATYSLDSIEAYWKSRLPVNWPVLDPKTGLRYDEALCVVHCFFFKPGDGIDTTRVEMISARIIQAELVGRRSPGIFERLGVVLQNGRTPKFTTHQIRHYLNTIAQRANVPQSHIAMWSGRRNVMQNAAYDHTDRDTIVDEIMARGDLEDYSVPVIVDDTDQSIRTTFLKQNITSTPIGFCLGDLRFSPCDKAGACLDCTRLVCVAEPGRRRDALARDVERRRQSVANFEQAEAQGRRVNPRAQTAARTALAHGERLLAAVDDPDRGGTLIPNATVSDLTGFSHDQRLGNAAAERANIENGKNE